ncbi:biotin--[acetyl-CoA-carboxylase] ligase [bacterium]|nr:biotin--[acetyl-CoA-carboxylase] ligase [bacterium]MBU1983716.1 biotin--[acetyl-CoA-carboxylase] ligase [bacterium]
MIWNQRLFDRHLTTRRFGREVEWLAEVDSTNRWLADHVDRFTMSGGVVVTDHQTKGRGRYDRMWHDKAGACLLFSLFIRQSTTDENSLGSLLPAIALADVLTARAERMTTVRVKWPNDVLLNGRKVAGILGQNLPQGQQILSIVGVGLNVSLREEDFPDDIKDSATSLFREMGTSVPREVILAEMLGVWEQLLDECAMGNIRRILDRWESYGPERGSRIVRRTDQTTLEGRYAGLGERGQLLLKCENGMIHEVFSGDIEP